jgi:hypothetical protein
MSKQRHLESLDEKLDAVGAAAKALLPELQAAFVDASKAGDHRKHAMWHRLHRTAHDFAVIVAEPGT